MSTPAALWESWPARPTLPLKPSQVEHYMEDAKSDMVMARNDFNIWVNSSGVLVNVERKDVLAAVAKGKAYLTPVMATALKNETAIVKVRELHAVFICGGPIVQAFREKIKPVSKDKKAVVSTPVATNSTDANLKKAGPAGDKIALLSGKDTDGAAKEIEALAEIAAAAIVTDHGISQIPYLHLV